LKRQAGNSLIFNWKTDFSKALAWKSNESKQVLSMMLGCSSFGAALLLEQATSSGWKTISQHISIQLSC
jgi:hypothetical protein